MRRPPLAAGVGRHEFRKSSLGSGDLLPLPVLPPQSPCAAPCAPVDNHPKPTGWNALLKETVRRILAGNVAHVLVGPIVRGEPYFYFVTGCATVGGAFHLAQLGAADRGLAEAWRHGLLAELIQHRPIVIHDFDDELEMARWAAVICPGEKTARILAALRRERGVA